MTLDRIAEIYLKTVRRAMNSRSPTGAKFYTETREGRFLNFKPKVFRTVLGSVIEGNREEENLCMKYFRRMKLIVVEKPGRFTNIQWINGKSVRVVTVDKEVLEVLTELTSKQRCFYE